MPGVGYSRSCCEPSDAFNHWLIPFDWSTDAPSPKKPQAGAQQAQSSSSKVKQLWRQGQGNVETLLHTVLDEVSSPQEFFDRFIGDTADFTILDMDSKPWNTHVDTSDGVLGKWREDCTREMEFLAYPVPVAFAPMNYVIRIEQSHRYQFVIEQGVEVLQFVSFILVKQSDKSPSGACPYADSFSMTQLWTIRPVANSQKSGTACEVHIIGEMNFVGRAPFVAPFIRRQAFQDHQEAIQGWLNGAYATLHGQSGIQVGTPQQSKKKSPQSSARDARNSFFAAARGKKIRMANARALLIAFLLYVLTVLASGSFPKILDAAQS